MTYCVGMLLRSGLVMVSDSRTNASVDNISTFRKMTIWEEPGERVIILSVAGNLAVSQSVITMLNEGVAGAGEHNTMMTVKGMTDAVRLVGRAIREVEEIDGPSLTARGSRFVVSMILGGQLAGREMRMFLIYVEGNHIESTPETPFFQIGELKYGKPIIDRVIRYDSDTDDAGKCALISLDSTMRSNLSVGPPFDFVICERDELRVKIHALVEENDTYMSDLRRRWSEGLLGVFGALPNLPWRRVVEPEIDQRRARDTV